MSTLTLLLPSVLTLTRRMDVIEDNSSAMSGGLCRVDDGLDELRRQQTTIRLRLDELRTRAAREPPSPTAHMPSSDALLRVPAGIFADDEDPSEGGDGARPCPLTQPVAHHSDSAHPYERHCGCWFVARCQARS